MQIMTDFILNGAETFTPEVIVSMLFYSMIVECIGSVAYALLKVWR